MKKHFKTVIVLMLSLVFIFMNIVTVSADEPTQKTYDANDTHQHETTSYLGNSMNLYVASPNHQIGAEIELIIYTDFSNEIVDITFSGDGFVLTNYFEVTGNEIHFSVTHTPENEEPFLSVNILLDNGDSFTENLFGIIRDELLFVNPYSYGHAQNSYLKYSGKYDTMRQLLDTLKENSRLEETTNATRSSEIEPFSNSETSSAITGHISWVDANGQPQPLRFCKIEFYERYENTLVSFLGEIYTDANGNYYFEFAKNAINVTVILYAQGTDITVCDDGGIPYWSWEEYEEHSSLANISLGSVVNLNLEYDFRDDYPIYVDRDYFPRALQVAQAAICASMYYEAMKGSDVEDVEVLYPYYEVDGSESTHYNYATKIICLAENIEETDFVAFRDDGKVHCFESWDAITHEYGHHVANCERITDSLGGWHDGHYMAEHYIQHFSANFDSSMSCKDLCALKYLSENNSFGQNECKYYGDALAWDEGFSTFFGEISQQYFKANYINEQENNPIPTFADYSYYAYNFSVSYDTGRILIEENDFRFSKTEIEVTRILFDLYDDGAVKITEDVETFDKVNCGHRGIWEYIINSGELIDTDGDGKIDSSTKPKTLYQFVEYLKSSNSGYPKSQLSNLNAILAEHGLATEAPIITTISASTPYVDFEWESDVSTTYYSAYKFQVKFYDSSYNLIGSTDPQVVDFDFVNDIYNVVYSGTITIDNQLWQTIMTYPSNFYVSVVMYECNGNINNPVTDPHTTSFESPYTMYLSPGHVHSYTHSYSKNNSTNHKAYCICGAYTLESHLFISVGLKTSCRDCGYITTGNVPVIRPTSIITGDENCVGMLPDIEISSTYYAENKKRSNTL